MLLSETPTHSIFDLFFKRIEKFHDKKSTIKHTDKTETTDGFFLKPSSQNFNFDLEKQKSNSSDFLNSIIHELKNPLNAIMGFSQVLMEEKHKISDSEHTEYLKDINESANDLNDLIHDLLDVRSLTSGIFSVDLSQELDVKNLIQRSIKLNYDYSLMRGVSLKSEIAEDVNLINLDIKRMKQILANLISNAIKYSPEQTETKISVKNIFNNNKKYLQILITDQGFGMTADQINLAFQKYQTLQNPNSGKVDSFGLGLPIVKQLVDLQNGTLEIKSELNNGTEIKLKFPYLM